MDSGRGQRTPSDPMESVCRHFSTPPHPQLHSDVYFLSLSRTDLRRSPMDYGRGQRTPSDPMESVCRHFSTPPHPKLYRDEYLLSLSRTDLRRSPMDNGRGQRTPSDPMESVCQHLAPHHIQNYKVILSLSRTDFRCVWLFTAFFHRTQVGCTGQPSWWLKGCVSLGQIISSGLSSADMSRNKLTFVAYL